MFKFFPILLGFLLIFSFRSAVAQTPVVLTPTVGLTASTLVTPVATVTPMASQIPSNNFQSMSDIHSSSLATPTPTPVEPPMDEHDPNYALAPKHVVSDDDFFERNKFQIEMSGGSDFLIQNFNTTDRLNGLGGNLSVGYLADDHWSIWLTESFYDFAPTDLYGEYDPYLNETFSYDEIPEAYFWETVFSFRYNFGGSFIKPYITLGVGFTFDYSVEDDVFENETDYGTSLLAPMIQAGLGFQIPLNSDLNFCLEAKTNFIFENLYTIPPYYAAYIPTTAITAIEVPVNAGIVINLFGDGKPTPVSTPVPPFSENLFVKTGFGLMFNQVYDGPYYEQTGTDTFVSLAAVGINLENHFSIFGSVEQTPGVWNFLGNLQYTVPLRNPHWSPYLFAGLGGSIQTSPGSQSTGACYQLGLGAEFRLSPEVALYTEGKLFITSLESDYDWSGVVIASTGLKFNLSRQPVTPSEPDSSGGHGFLQIAEALDIPSQNWQPAYSTAGGSIIGAGYEFKDGLALQLDIQNFYFTGDNDGMVIEDNEVQLLPTVRCHFFKGIVRPYVLAGVGADLEFSTSALGNATVAYLDAAVGFGLDVPFEESVDLFAEGKYNFVFADGVIGQDIPVLAGVRLGL